RNILPARAFVSPLPHFAFWALSLLLRDFSPTIIRNQTFMKILVCSDGSERARRALASAAIVANATKAETTIFGIIEIGQDEQKLLETLREESKVFREQ